MSGKGRAEREVSEEEATRPLAGRHALVTGATSGIGEETVLALARRGAVVLLAGRTEEKCRAAAERVRAQLPEARLELVAADLSSMANVRGLARRVLEVCPRLELLVNNAGCFRSARRVTEDGFEETWAVNYLAPFLLTRLLLPRLIASAPARVVNVCSEAHRQARPDWLDLVGVPRYSGLRTYSESKLALLMFTFELARRVPAEKVTINGVHPGMVSTHLGNEEEGRGVVPFFFRHTLSSMGTSPAEGAQTSVFAAIDPSLAGITGQYLAHSQIAESSVTSHDAVVAHRLWNLTERLVGLPPLGRPDEEPSGAPPPSELEIDPLRPVRNPVLSRYNP